MKTRTGYLIRRGRVFYAVWTVARKKFMRTTHKTDRREAKTELARIMQPYLVEDEVRTLENVRARIEGAKAELVALDEQRNPPLTVTAAWSAYMSAPGRPDSGEGTLSMYEGQFAAFADWLKRAHPDLSACGNAQARAPALRDVTPEIAGVYAAHLTRERGFSANTFNKHVGFLELLFRVLKDPARLTVNPWEGIQRKRVVSESRRELTIDELRTVCAAATGEMRLLFALGIYTGLRRADAATLRWAEVDLRRRLIRRVPGKTRRRTSRPVIIPIHPTLAAMLNETPADEQPALPAPSRAEGGQAGLPAGGPGQAGRREYVLPETAALYLKSPQELSRRIQDLFQSVGVKTQKRGTGKGTSKRAVVEVGFHSLRHTFVSLCRESNAPLAVVEAIVGHSNPAMTRLYTHVSELAAARAINALPDIAGDMPAPELPPAKLPDAEKVRALADKLNGRNWRTVKRELLAVIA